ncbi:hypothetical protein C5167_006242 [Papaver somniferum]|uniref:Uncharacterized protein n=1 Tax=Papaver somniferum TaxID=3469 RepID=A0A4Y7JG90_PAPSO|nr:hypothetical protein C5167_006242 [Papaver somniferum]
MMILICLRSKSLSETLVHFYPMAGRMKDNIVIDCNDEGIGFSVVKIKGKMCDFMMQPNESLNLLLPSEVVSMKFVKEAQVIVQVNMFNCGGTAICLCTSHKIADLCTMSTFIRNWAGTTNTTRDGGAIAAPTTNQNLLPSFDSASLFPPREQLVSPSGVPPIAVPYPQEDVRGDKIVSKRFVFDAVKITSLREKLEVLMHGNYKSSRPTRVEVVAALIWKAAVISSPAGSLSTVNLTVNYRKRIDPPLLDVSFGNFTGMVTVALSATTATKSTTNHTSIQLTEFVAQLRGEINMVKGDKSCIEKIFLRCVGDYVEPIAKNITGVENEGLALLMTSWCRFGLYDADFGWGKPIWVTTDPFIEPNKNIIVMNDTKCGDGIEV